ncbi:M16 family metallopeptidase [Gellertiella hungarica]|uniref:Putative Zn-dependent peptidase n=1 Tax=Gellertiella hungarica TaxID=1572859 RepID=A0A7W6NJS3_9HYPH|nr:pitrilysin family protein [Gellertiella hungarica]MBB4063577.1 putative Zn-dependent peptidase [Gellertiella hungarica]
MLIRSPLARIVSASLLAATLSFPLPLGAEQQAPEIEQYKLENGLTVVLAPTRNSQTVSTVVLYEVGSADEKPGRSGFAHLFEHLMFEGTPDVPDYDAAISAVGGENNAYTEWDSTTYHNTGPKEALPEFIRLEADRMANLANGVTQEDLDNQRAVVLNEMRQNTLDSPGGAAVEQMNVELAPAGHPYAHAVIGSIKDLQAARLEDVVAFHRLNYLPDRATLAISGNFDVTRAKADIELTFGLIPAPDRGWAVTRWFNRMLEKIGLGSEAGPVPPLGEPKQLVFKDAVTEPAISMAWPGPEGLSKEAVEHMLLGAVLSTGKSSLQQKLVIDERIANSAGAGFEFRNLGGTFSVSASAAKGVPVEKLETALRTTLGAIAAEGISPEALDAARSQLKEGLDNLPNSPLGFAIGLANAAAWGGDAATWRDQETLAREVTPEELTDLLKSLLDRPAVSVRLLPGPRNATYPPALADSTGALQPEEAPARPDIPMPKLEMDAVAGLELPEMSERVLANGAKLLVYKSSDAQRASIAIVVPGGTTAAEPALADIALGIGSRGLGDTPLVSLDQKLKQEGISLSGNAGAYRSVLGASAPLKKFDTAAFYLSQAIMRPRFDAKEWKAMIEGAMTGIEQRRLDPGYQALRGLVGQIYPANAAEARESTAEGLQALTPERARSIFDGLVQPERATVHVVAALDADDVKARLDKAFAGWTGGRNAPLSPEPVRPTVAEGLTRRPVEGATQSMIIAAMKAPSPETADGPAFDLAVRILGGTFKSRLNLVLREEKGWSYGISAETQGTRGLDNALLYIQAAVDTAHTSDSLGEIRRIVKEMATRPITPEEFETARKTMKSEFLSATANGSSLAGLVVGLESTGYTLGDLATYLKRIDDLTLQDVQAQASRIAAQPIAISVAGDPKQMK